MPQDEPMRGKEQLSGRQEKKIEIVKIKVEKKVSTAA